MILIKIVKGRDWYEHCLGEEYYVKYFNEKYFYPINQAIQGAYKILKTDCDIITNREINPRDKYNFVN